MSEEQRIFYVKVHYRVRSPWVLEVGRESFDWASARYPSYSVAAQP